MAYTTFKSIPDDVVNTECSTWAAIRSSIKHQENMQISAACMREADARLGDALPYRVRAYRRLAILVAVADYPLISDRGRKSLMYSAKDLGMSRPGSTWTFISDYIACALLAKKIKNDFTQCLPPEWRANITANDPRIYDALELIDFWSCRSYKSGMKSYMTYASTTPSKDEAYKFYSQTSLPEMNMMKAVINQHIMSSV